MVHTVVPHKGLQTTSAPWVLSLAPPLGTLCFVQWMAVSIHFCICQALADPLRRQLYQAPVSKHLSWHSPTQGHRDPQDQGSLLPLMSDKVILCYKCSWSHGSLHVYSLDGGYSLRAQGDIGWFILFLLWGCKPLQLLGSFL